MWRLLQQGGLADFWHKAAAVGIQLDMVSEWHTGQNLQNHLQR